MKVIWKYPIENFDYQEIELPRGSSIISAQVQHKKVVLWAIVDPSRELVKRNFFVLMTGQETKKNIFKTNYIGTCQCLITDLVYHVFEAV